MAEGGFSVKFDGKEVTRCYAIAFDYDDLQYTTNNKETKKLPSGVKSIAIIVEQS